MSQTQRPGHGVSDDDLFIIIFGGLALSGVLITAVIAFAIHAWHNAVSWMLAHHLLVTSAAHPVLRLPHAGGAGLDTPRCLIGLGILAAALYLATEAVRRRIARARELA